MSFRLVRTTCAFFLCFFLLPLFTQRVCAQAPAGGATGQAAAPAAGATGGLTGFVTDPSGAGIPKASVRLTSASGTSYDGATNKEGIYELKDLPPGAYTLKAAAKGFALFTKENVQIIAKQQVQVNISLSIQIEEQKVEVTDETTKVDVNPSNNAGTVVMKGKDLEALSDDPDELQSELEALAGPSAGPNGGQIYIDGFTAGQLPPKASIREIRINQNPFSSEYDKLGYGRIEIFTKPGTEKFRGSAFYNFSDDVWNSRNPYAQRKAPFLLKEYGGNLSGPITKRASFFVDVRRDATDNGSIINGITLDPETLGIVNPFTDIFRVPQRRLRVSPRLDYQLSTNNTLTMRYGFNQSDVLDAGLGGFNLVSRAYHVHNLHQTAH